MTNSPWFARALAACALLLPSCAVTGFFTYGLTNVGVNSIDVGDPAPDVTVSSLYGEERQLHDFFRGRPLVLVFGSFT